jgi:hypothetical protein
MAKAKDLAILAGLAGLAYVNRDKLFGGKDKDKGPSATAEEEEASKVRMDAQKNAVSGNRVTNESSYTGTTKNDSNAAKNIGFGGGDDSDKNLRLSSTPVTQSVRSGKSAAKAVAPTPSDPRNLEAGMSRGTRTPAKSLSTASSSEEGMKNYKPRRTTPSAGAGRGFVNPPMPTPKDPREAESGMSRGTRTTTPPFRGGQMGYDEAGNFMGGQRGFDEAGNPMKKGGMVKKMASGGMSASRRADGIATKGKTRGKMC